MWIVVAQAKLGQLTQLGQRTKLGQVTQLGQRTKLDQLTQLGQLTQLCQLAGRMLRWGPRAKAESTWLCGASAPA